VLPPANRSPERHVGRPGRSTGHLSALYLSCATARWTQEWPRESTPMTPTSACDKVPDREVSQCSAGWLVCGTELTAGCTDVRGLRLPTIVQICAGVIAEEN